MSDCDLAIRIVCPIGKKLCIHAKKRKLDSPELILKNIALYKSFPYLFTYLLRPSCFIWSPDTPIETSDIIADGKAQRTSTMAVKTGHINCKN